MALVLGDNFSYGGAKPLDARLTYNTLAQMKAVADATMYDGCTAYCKEADKTYQWKSTNTVDENTGKWREFSSGGSTGGGHTIEDSEGTDLTQRDTLQFGEGFKAEDDSTNEKTVISPDVMQSGDMDEVISPLPSIQPRYHKYSTTEQVVGEWIDGKPIYQKTITFSNITFDSAKQYYYSLTGLDIDKAWVVNGFHYGGDYVQRPLDVLGQYKVTTWGIQNSSSPVPNSFYLQSSDGTAVNRTFYITIQYTKTTDTPNT